MAKISLRTYTSISEARDVFLGKVDSAVEAHREVPAAKVEAYRSKYEDACRVLAGGRSSGWIDAESSESGAGVAEVARSVSAAWEAEQLLAARIEALRVTAKANVRSASSIEELQGILATLKSKLETDHD